MDATTGYRIVAQNLDRSLALTANRAPVKLGSEYWMENAGNVSSIEEFVGDSRLFRFAMTAFGLEELADAKGYMRKILEEGIAEPGTLANRTNDPRISEFARTFDFATFGADTMQRQATGQAVVDQFVRQTLEVEAGELDGEGVRLALYFERKAPEVNTVFEILADPALLKVVRTTLGLPQEFSGADLQRQAEVISDRLDIADLSDPEALRDMLIRFTAVWDATENTASSPLLRLFSTGGQQQSVASLNLALSLSSLRLGGA
ncbi:DUF1217 domain-containing protein [Acuticoccus sp. MNP-M23]|uniref:DUF1217 domain-containing protein n=1 Tax=Acuticoccus sp. MNP-M23 TaxID=3072793 RepID=UPI00281568AA|nr:DUF1217 domain-containing protein [Acuticoccus sp. MNP-M23]WMS41805.1 DUF1217 domain-containing protein [Acuticoccus sp. MNP-M23]